MNNKKALVDEIKKDKRIDFWQGLMLGLTIVLLTVAAVGLYVQDRAKDEYNENLIKGINELKKQAETINAQQQQDSAAIRQVIEVGVCLYALEASSEKVAEIFPGADLSKCAERLRGVNNADDSFLSREADGQGTFTDPQRNNGNSAIPKENSSAPPDPLVDLCVIRSLCLEVK